MRLRGPITLGAAVGALRRREGAGRGTATTRLHPARADGALRLPALLPVLCAAPCCFAQHEWTHFAGDAAHTSVAATAPTSISNPTWRVSTDFIGRPIAFIGQAGLVCTRDLVMAYGSVAVGTQRQYFLWAIDRRSGGIRWALPIPAPYFDSWSAPVVDLRNQTVICAVFDRLIAADLTDGSVRWQTPLAGRVVDASPIVTSDIPLRNRLFITTYDGLGDSARLYCVNIDPFVFTTNSFAPGDVVWSTAIGGSSGSTPAYARNDEGIPTVYVASLGFGYPENPSLLIAFRADTELSPFPSWILENPKQLSYFFGGVSLARSGGRLYAYTASYSFLEAETGLEGVSNSNLIKVDATTGSLVWTVDSNRTSASPIPLPNNRILLSTGLCGYSSAPALELFQDHGAFATREWNSALSTWADFNGDGKIGPGEFSAFGGWSHQPLRVASDSATSPVFVGALPCTPACFPCALATEPCTDLYLINANVAPGSPGFIQQHFVGAGSTPAVADSNLYTVGAAGLFAFGPPPPNFDVNGDLKVDTDDLLAWDQGYGLRDVDLDGSVTVTDRDALEADIRAGEFQDMKGGRP